MLDSESEKTSEVCNECKGRGWLGTERCPVCHGFSTVIRQEPKKPEQVLLEGRMASIPEELLPDVLDESGKIGASVYRRGRSAGVGRATRKAKENAAGAADRQVKALGEAQRARKKLQLMESKSDRAFKRYGLCKKCRRVIMPRSKNHAMFLEGSLERGEKIDFCYDCNRNMWSRVGRAKFNILRRRGKNPRMKDGKLECDP